MSSVLNLVGGGGNSIKTTDAILRIIAPYGSLVSISVNGVVKSLTAITITDDPSKNCYYTILKPAQFGTVTITTVLENDSLTKTVSVNTAGEYTITISFWNGELYVLGNQYTAYTGGWVAKKVKTIETAYSYNAVFPTLTFGESNMVASVSAEDSANSTGSIITANKIDLTNFDKITFIVNQYCSPNSRLALYYVTDVDTATDGMISPVASVSNYTQGDRTIELDVSALSGEFYVGFNLLAGSGTSGTMTITVSSIICS